MACRSSSTNIPSQPSCRLSRRPTSCGWSTRFGPIRVSQAGLFLCLAGLAAASSGLLPAVLLGALLLGLGYGPATPASSMILARAAPPHLLALTFSIKQTGVPLGTARG